MAESKSDTLPQDVQKYIDAISEPGKKKDCEELIRIMQEVSQYSPEMWGVSIIGFGRYHYKYASGHEGDSCLIGLSSRKNSISVYLAPESLEDETRLKQLGNVKAGKGCLYITDLKKVDLPMLRNLLTSSIAVRKNS